MSNGRIHDKLTNQISLIMLAYLFIASQGNLVASLAGFLGAQLQRFCTPDTDVNSGYYGLFLFNWYFGNLLGVLWKILWYPFRWIPHRHWLTHGVLIGSILRFSYVFILIWGVVTWTHYQIKPSDFVTLFFMFYGFLVADLGHLLLDFVPIFRGLYERLYANL